MAKNKSGNTYEEARNQRLQDNLKRFQDLGIQKISKSLSKITPSEKKASQHHAKSKSTTGYETLELRRSLRARNSAPSYRDDADVHLRIFRRSNFRKPSCDIRMASYEERILAMEIAENLQKNLKFGHPSFVKSMVRSHVSSCFWLGLPRKFCKDHLPRNEVVMVLEDEKGEEYDTIYIGSRTGLSGGWKGFALEHKLDDGDALLFELTEPTKFKVYIVKASDDRKLVK